jgi:hypothetical protein
MFTIFGELNLDYDRKAIQYLIGQKEICPKTGNVHFQGYLEGTRPLRLSEVKNALCDQGVHLEKRNGSQAQAIGYVTKKETAVEGTLYQEGIKKEMGKRNDLEHIVNQLNNKIPIKDIIQEEPSALKYINHMQKYEALLVPERNWVTEVIVIIGEPNTGKTRYVWDNEKDIYTVPEASSSQFFDGYTGQEVVLFDDFEGEIKYRQMLKLCDRYPMKVNIKGGMVNWAPKKIYITSNKEIAQWYPWEDNVCALNRRVTMAHRFGTEVAGNTDRHRFEGKNM